MFFGEGGVEREKKCNFGEGVALWVAVAYLIALQVVYFVAPPRAM